MPPSLLRRLKKKFGPKSNGNDDDIVSSSPSSSAAAAAQSAPLPSTEASSTAAAAAPTPAPAPAYTCHTCSSPISTSEIHIHTNRPLTGIRRYHKQCFVCLHCQAPIDPSTQPFIFEKVESNAATARPVNNNSNTCEVSPAKNTEVPFHKECYADHFGWICVVCEQPLPLTVPDFNPDGTKKEEGYKFEYLKHPFFEKERMCPYHAVSRQETTANNGTANTADDPPQQQQPLPRNDDHIGQIRRCAGCHRFEPLFAAETKHFIDVGDSDTGRCVCLACCRTIVTTSQDAQALWTKVVHFFEGPLGLITEVDTANGVSRKSMSDIPVLVVGSDALNDNLKQHSTGVHYQSSQIMTRGLCLSEHCPTSDEALGVTAILCLSGLPADLTASILAHEAMHAWLKLHPNFRYREQLPLRVEEGLCQLVAFLFLNDGLDPLEEDEGMIGFYAEEERQKQSLENESIPSDVKLRQYFKFCIETDQSVYGEGFRLAARAYASMGMQELLYYVALNHDFPPDNFS
mmetsp:Transcript_21554/g.43189  ORF Transcript_21554/g.43189 Transcript_21554/m.43189 type:complete len:516 (-) Transcript_21554:186-1733(-)